MSGGGEGWPAADAALWTLSVETRFACCLAERILSHFGTDSVNYSSPPGVVARGKPTTPLPPAIPLPPVLVGCVTLAILPLLPLPLAHVLLWLARTSGTPIVIAVESDAAWTVEGASVCVWRGSGINVGLRGCKVECVRCVPCHRLATRPVPLRP